MELLASKEEQHISSSLDKNFMSADVYSEENDNHSEMNSKVIDKYFCQI